MAAAGSLQVSYNLGLCRGSDKQFKSILGRGKSTLLSPGLPSHAWFQKQVSGSIHLPDNVFRPMHSVPCRSKAFRCYSSLLPGQAFELPGMKAACRSLTRSYGVLEGSPLIFKLVPAVGVIIFAVWGLAPLMCQIRRLLLPKSDNNWKKSRTYYVMTSYIQPLLLWTGAILICRVLDPLVMPTEPGQLVKQRLLNFVRSLSTVLAFAYCLSSVIQQAQKFFMEPNEPSDTRNMGFQFAGKAVSSAVWVAAFSLFMELLGFSTQKWLTAGGLGTVLLTLAGREIFTNFLSSAMIHATQPFVVNDWIQTRIEGYEVSGTVEHVGWWSPTIIRGEDREAVHIPNHKFTVNVVRNLSQKTHWRIKTHLAISHLDVNKINNIVPDMRKVLAKNPQVEQRKLHKRVFLDYIDPENQALLILISCFVKTSRHEEYLRVKDAILMDLLRVISHHGARLATPIRTVQKMYGDSSLETFPFADSIYNNVGVASNRPLLLIEPSYRINGENKAKSQTRGERDGKTLSRSTPDTKAGGSPKSESKVKETSKSDTKADVKTDETTNSEARDQTKAATISDPEIDNKMPMKSSPNSATKTNSNAAETSSSESKAAGSSHDNSIQNKKMSDKQQSKRDNPGNESFQSKQETERKSVQHPSMPTTGLEENIVLGVALEGSKRTLPIEEGVDSHPTTTEAREKAPAYRSGTRSPSAGKDHRKDDQIATSEDE